MESLRLILLLVGVAFVLGLYGWIRFKQGARKVTSAQRTRPDVFEEVRSDDPGSDELDAELARMGRLVAEKEEPPESEVRPESASQPRTQTSSAEISGEQLIVISIMAPADKPFSGASLIRTLRHNRLRYDGQKFYHRDISQGDEPRPVFTVANAVNPGGLPGSAEQEFNSPGITLFLQLPGPMDGLKAFDDMLLAAERMAVELGGELQDQQHMQLTEQAVASLRNSAAGASMSVTV